MYILGISAFYHDSAACLLKDGQVDFLAKRRGSLEENMTLVSPLKL